MKKLISIIFFLLTTTVYSQVNIQQIFFCDSIYIAEFKKFTNVYTTNKSFYFLLGAEGTSIFSIDVRSKRWYRYIYNTGQFVYNMHNNILGSSWTACPPYGFPTYSYTENFVLSFKDTNLILFSNAGSNCVEPFGFVRYTTNNGLNWVLTPYWSDFLGSGLRGFDIASYNDSIIYVAYIQTNNPANIFKSTNRGLNWQTMDTVPNINNTSRILAADKMKRNYLYLTKQKGILRSTDGGRFFHEVNCDSVVASSFEFDMTDSSVYLTSSSGATGIFKSTDHGENWSKIFNKQCAALEIDPASHNIIYAGADSVIYRSTNGGASWSLYHTGIIPKKPIVGICKNPGNDTIYVATKKGVYKIWGPYSGIKQISDKVPDEYKLFQNYPNPFNPISKIWYSVPSGKYQISKTQTPSTRGQKVLLIVYNSIGQEIVKLVDIEQGAGYYEAEFDGTICPSGVYYYQLITEGFNQTKKMVLIK